MARSLASATISFGLVAVPVQLFPSAETRENVSFHLLSKKSGKRVKQQYVDPSSDEVIPRTDVVKGYETAKGQYVVFTPQELKALDEKATGSIDITEFVPLERVDREYLDKVYYLGPGKGGDRSYRLLNKALEETGRAALGQYAARGQQYLILIRPKDKILVMEQLHYASELRSTDDVPAGEGTVKASELAMAKQLIAQGANDEFEPENYHDTVRDRVRSAIEKRVEGHEITAEPSEESGARIIDLMEALKASLSQGKQAEKAPARKKRKTAAPPGRRLRKSA